MYISIIVKGNAEFVTDLKEKTNAVNALMEKSQTDGKYNKRTPDMEIVHRLGLIKIVPETLNGKYKFGKSWDDAKKLRVATKLLERSVESPKLTVNLFNIAGPDALDDKILKDIAWTHASKLIKILGYENSSKYPNISPIKVKEVDW